MRTTRFVVLVAALALAACKDAPPPTRTPDVLAVLPDLPFPPDAEFVSRAGSEDALQLVFRSAQSVDAVSKYYRAVFTRGEWRLIGDDRDSAGAVVLYAERPGPPMWVRITAPRGRKKGMAGA